MGAARAVVATGATGSSGVVVAGSVVSFGPVGEGQDVGAVGFESVSPVFAVVVEVAASALGDAVGEVGEPALLPGCDVVDLALLGLGAAAGAPAPQGEQGAALGGGEGSATMRPEVEDAVVGGEEQLHAPRRRRRRRRGRR